MDPGRECPERGAGTRRSVVVGGGDFKDVLRGLPRHAGDPPHGGSATQISSRDDLSLYPSFRKDGTHRAGIFPDFGPCGKIPGRGGLSAYDGFYQGTDLRDDSGGGILPEKDRKISQGCGLSCVITTAFSIASGPGYVSII